MSEDTRPNGGATRVGEEFRDRLLAERRQLLREYRDTDEDLSTLEAFDRGEPEVEERAQQSALARILVRIEDQQQRHLREIQDALGRIVDGSFGTCARCGGEIPRRRLEAIPSASRCVDCAKVRERESRRSESPTPTAEPPVLSDYAELTDEELVEAVRDALRELGQGGLRDVRAHAHGGRVTLEGEVSSEEHRDLAVQIIADHLGLAVKDELRIVRFPLETGEVVRPADLPRDQPELVRAREAHEESEDVLEVEEEGIGFSPPGRPVRPPRKE